MNGGTDSAEDRAHAWARTAREGFSATADYLGSLPEDGWAGPTGCARWTVRDLAGHVVGEAVWFPNLVRGVTRGDAPLPMRVYEDLKRLPPGELTRTLDDAARDIEASVADASHDQLQQPVDLGFARLPIWRATFVSAVEAVFHNWDARARRERRATIPVPWAEQLAGPITPFAPMIAHRARVSEAPGTYRLEVLDGLGPVTVTARAGDLSVERGAQGSPDVTLYLSSDQYLRLLAGRLPLDSEEGRDVRIEGDRGRAAGLNRIFGGIANE